MALKPLRLFLLNGVIEIDYIAWVTAYLSMNWWTKELFSVFRYTKNLKKGLHEKNNPINNLSSVILASSPSKRNSDNMLRFLPASLKIETRYLNISSEFQRNLFIINKYLVSQPVQLVGRRSCKKAMVPMQACKSSRYTNTESSVHGKFVYFHS